MRAELISVLEGAHLFSGMKEEAGNLLLDYFEWVSLPPREEIVFEGDVPVCGVLLISGSFEIMARLGGRQQLLTVAGRGTFLGDLGLAQGRTRDITCRAIDAGEVGLLSQERLHEMSAEAPGLYTVMLANFSRILVSRLNEINEAVLNLSGEVITTATARKIVGKSVLS